MTTLDFEPLTIVVPLREEPSGVLRVGKSRVLLELVLHAFKAGATPEAIVQSYDTLNLADVYAVVSRYLAAPGHLRNTCASATRWRRKRGARSRKSRALRAICARSCWRVRKPRRRRVLKLISDENFNGDILRGLYRRRPDLDVVRVQDIGLNATPDQDIFARAAAEGRILLTHDRDTVPYFAYYRVRAGQVMPGLFLSAM